MFEMSPGASELKTQLGALMDAGIDPMQRPAE
jgi:hypothetical protein